MDNNSTVHRNFGFLSNAGFSMEEKNGNMENSPHFGFDSKDSGGSGESNTNQTAAVGSSDANKGNQTAIAGGFCSNKGNQQAMAGGLCSNMGNQAETAADSCGNERNQSAMVAGGFGTRKGNQVAMAGDFSADKGNLAAMAGVSGANRGNEAIIAAMPLNVACPEDSNWSSVSSVNGIISVVPGKGRMSASEASPIGGSVTSNDNMIGLELGKRTYFEVPGGGGSTNNQGPNQTLPKRPRASGQTPKCQVEGCKADLSSAKEYHRRHKVCAIHSKATQVIVGGQEQRFCQQCSRFHGLSEFDEGKRSCRRRLAGHNERRRKPQPDPLGFNPRFLPSFQDSRKLGHLYKDRPSFVSHPRISGVSALYDECNLTQKGAWPQRISDQSSLENTMSVGTVAERQLFLTALQYSNDRSSLFPPQSPKGMISVGNDVSGPKTHQYFQGSVDPLGQSLSLTSSSSSGVGVLSGLEAIPIGQGFTRVSDSGRALSLQSNMQLSSSTPASVAVSMDMTTNSSMMSNQNLYSNHIPLAQPLGQGGQQQQQHHYEWMSDKLLSAGSSFNTHSSAASAGYNAHSNTIEKNNLDRSFTPSMNGSYECLPLYSMMQGEVRLGSMTQDVKPTMPTIDLMQMASASTNQTTQALVSSGAYEIGISGFGDLQALGSYDSSMFGSQQM